MERDAKSSQFAKIRPQGRADNIGQSRVPAGGYHASHPNKKNRSQQYCDRGPLGVCLRLVAFICCRASVASVSVASTCVSDSISLRETSCSTIASRVLYWPISGGLAIGLKYNPGFALRSPAAMLAASIRQPNGCSIRRPQWPWDARLTRWDHRWPRPSRASPPGMRVSWECSGRAG